MKAAKKSNKMMLESIRDSIEDMLQAPENYTIEIDFAHSPRLLPRSNQDEYDYWVEGPRTWTWCIFEDEKKLPPIGSYLRDNKDNKNEQP